MTIHDADITIHDSDMAIHVSDMAIHEPKIIRITDKLLLQKKCNQNF